MIQANSSASEKVCDHPSTEAVWLWRFQVGKERRWSEWRIVESVPEFREINDYGLRNKTTELREFHAAPPAVQVIANPENLHGRLPESSDPSLLGRETVREALVEISDRDWLWTGGGSDVRRRGLCGQIAAKALGIAEALPLGWPDPRTSETKIALSSLSPLKE